MNDVEQQIIDKTLEFATAVTDPNGSKDAKVRAAQITELFTEKC